MRPATHTIVTTVRIVARKRYRTARLMLKMPRWTQLMSLNSFWIWKVLFLWPNPATTAKMTIGATQIARPPYSSLRLVVNVTSGG